MSNVIKLKRGLESNIPSDIKDGEVVITTDTNKLYSNRGEISPDNVVVSSTQPVDSNVDVWINSNGKSDVTNLEDRIELLENRLSKYWETVYPVGSIYLSIADTNPSQLFGGTWNQVSHGRMLIGAKLDNYCEDNNITQFGTLDSRSHLFRPEDKGGEYTHRLMESESGIRDHTHQIRLSTTAGVGSYSDTAYRAYIGGNVDEEFRTGRTTGYSTLSNDYGAPFVSGTDTANAVYSHNNMPPYYTVFIWKRVS